MAESLALVDDAIALLDGAQRAVGRGSPASRRILRAAERRSVSLFRLAIEGSSVRLVRSR